MRMSGMVFECVRTPDNSVGEPADSSPKELSVPQPENERTAWTAGRACRIAAILAAAGGASLMGGCEADSFMDPSVAGRWEHTPTIMPILDRIASIEDETGEFVEYSDPTADDLIAQPRTYRLSPGDELKVTIYDIVEPNRPEEYSVIIDARGTIEIPQLGKLMVSGLTTESARAVIEDATRKYVSDPLVSVVPASQRSQVFNILGAVQNPGPYFIPKADFRLLEAITSGGNFDESIQEVYVIRQAALSEVIGGESSTTEPYTGNRPNVSNPNNDGVVPAKPTGEDLIDLIDEIAPPKAPAAELEAPGATGGSPAMFASASQQPEPPSPVVDLVEGSVPIRSDEGGTNWVFINDQWVQVTGGRKQVERAAQTGEDLVTQRVIRIPLKQLLAGKQTLNIVIRPGDILRVPAPPSGLVYMTGQVSRPGTYQIPADGQLTLLRALDSAGGLNYIAIPERIDLTRMVGRDRQATIRLDGRAISEQTQPDVFLKPNDRVNVGTNFWALPLALIRNGFRTSYGFGFLVDRNFGNDVFGIPPGSPNQN